MEGEYATPRTTDREVSVEAKTNRHHEQSNPDRREVLPCLLHEDANEHRGEGEGEDKGKEVHSAENRGGAEDSLKVEREEIGAGNEDHAVDEADG